MKTSKDRVRKSLQLTAILLIGVSGFFIARTFLFGSTPASTYASVDASASEGQVSDTDALTRIQDLLSQLRRTIGDPARVVSVASLNSLPRTSPPRAISREIGRVDRESVAPTTVAPPFPRSSNQQSLSPFVQPSPSSSLAQHAPASIRLGDLSVTSSLSDGFRLVVVTSHAHNEGAVASANIPAKVFVTTSDGNSTLLGEQLIPSVAPNGDRIIETSYRCPFVGDVEVCVVIPEQFSIATTESSNRICERIIVDPLPISGSTTPTSSATTTTTTTTPAPTSGSACRCNP